MQKEIKVEQLRKIGLDVSRETINDLLFFEAELFKWNKNINLISDNTKNQIWERHILDSAQLNKFIKIYNNVLDIGSGGGFPAIVLAILNKHNEGFKINLIEKLNKKCVFLQNIVARLKLPATIHNMRIEEYKCDNLESIVITSRAFANLDNILTLTESFFKNSKCVAFLQKGKNFQNEIVNAKKNWHFFMYIYNSKLQDGSVILKITDVRKLSSEKFNE